MSKLKKLKKMSGIQKSRVTQNQLAQEKQNLLKAAKSEDLKEKKKKKFAKTEDNNVLDRFKKKPKK